MYPAELVKPMRDDLASAGFEELYTAEAVKDAIKAEGTTLVVVNSVCGCAAANARPAAKMSLKNDKTPARLVTVFAGVDREAVDALARHHGLTLIDDIAMPANNTRLVLSRP